MKPKMKTAKSKSVSMENREATRAVLRSMQEIKSASVAIEESGGRFVPLVRIATKGGMRIELTLSAFVEIYKGLCRCWGPVKQLEKCARRHNQAVRVNKGKAPPESFETLAAQFPAVPLARLKKQPGIKIDLSA